MDALVEKNSIIEILEKTDCISDLPKNFNERCLRLLNLIIFSFNSNSSFVKRTTEAEAEHGFMVNFLIRVKRKIDYGEHLAYSTFDFDTLQPLIAINPYGFFSLSITEMIAVLKHEVYHIINNHFSRSKAFIDSKKYSLFDLNIAMDLSINQFIQGLPEGCITMQSFKIDFVNQYTASNIQPAQSFEYYLQFIDKENSRSYSDANNMFQQSIKNSSNGNNDKICKNFNDGLNGHAHSNKTLDGQSNNMNSELMKNTVNKIIKDSFKELSDKYKGSLPNNLNQIIEITTNKKETPWQSILKRFTGSVPVPYRKTILRNDRRQPNRLELKGRIPDHEVNITIAIDTSGSMDDNLLKDCITEVFFILKQIKNKQVRLIQCDSEIQSVEVIKSPNDVKKISIKGRGGTKFSPVFQYLRKHRMNSDILIYFTDGYGEDELVVKPNNFRTLWVIFGGNKYLSLKDPCGLVCKLDEDNFLFKN